MVEGPRLQLRHRLPARAAVRQDDDLKVGKYVENTAKALGGEIKVVSFVSYERGEGLEKREDDFCGRDR